MNSNQYVIEPIGYIKSPFAEKFAVPRQSVLIHNGVFEVIFYPPYDNEQAFVGLEEFSHIYLVFLFHLNKNLNTVINLLEKREQNSNQLDTKLSLSFSSIKKDFTPMVRPPRLGGNKFKGVFATRSPNRPNNIGLSCVKLLEVKNNNGKVSLIIEGADLVNNTPIIDVKPYIGFVDSIKDAKSGYATVEPTKIEVVFSEEVLGFLSNISIANFKELISEVLSQDPRPAYKQKSLTDTERVYGVQLYDYNVQWKMVSKDVAFVVNIAKV